MVAERFESAWWQTSSLLLTRDGQAVAIDPGVTREEVARIEARAAELGVEVAAVLATHADWDHVCGIAAFPDAEAAMGERTAELVRTGVPAERIEGFANEHHVAMCGPPRAERRLTAGLAHRVGPFTVETLALPGHTPDGTGYRIRLFDLLVVGDHLSSIEFPYVTSTAAYRGTLATLIDLLRRDPPGRVVPGHGPEHSASDALAIAEADLDYLWRLYDAVADARLDGPDAARAAGLAVELPRAVADEEMRGPNVEAQLAELLFV